LRQYETATKGLSMSRNLFLAALSGEDYTRLQNSLTPVSLEKGTILEEAGKPVLQVYFPGGLMASIVAVADDGARIEAGIIGCEGVTGTSDLLGNGFSSHLIEVQEAGDALCMDAQRFRSEFQSNPAFQQLAMSYHQYLFGQVAQTTLCNRAHLIEGRLSRWLLMSQDAVQSDTLHLTQEYLSIMLGAHRPAITKAAQALRLAGGISYSRRSITITNRLKLVGSVCGCYAIGQGQRAQLLDGATAHPPSIPA
jgi:CRP-like cAMP-binding protein